MADRQVAVDLGGAHCARCGHSWTVHGGGVFDRWCIAWDGARFCGCTLARPELTRGVRQNVARNVDA